MKVTRGPYSTLGAEGGRWALTLGTFDGVHLGHQAVFAELARVGATPGFSGSCAVTFGRHPRTLLAPDSAPDRLSSEVERELLLAACGLDHLVVLEFDEHLARLEYDVFVKEVLLKRLGMAHFVLGHDVHFGRGRGGNVRTVTELGHREGFAIGQVVGVRDTAGPISSTRIRQALQEGEFEAAIAMLGHPYLLRGAVEEGRRLGRTLGFPTANLRPDHPRKVLPPVGVYAGWARVDGPDEEWCSAVVNVGRAPTVAAQNPVRVEVHLIDQDRDLYGRSLTVAVAQPLRPERRFEGLEALKEAIGQDLEAAREWYRSAPEALRPQRLEPGGLIPTAPAPRGRKSGPERP